MVTLFVMKLLRFLFFASFGYVLLFPVHAELQKNWEIVTVDKEAVYFLDRNSIVLSEEEVARVWQLKNFRQIKRVPPQSVSAQMDYDCEKSRKRIFLKHHHSGVMAKGRLRVANTEGQFDWKPIGSGLVEGRIFFIVCGKEPKIMANSTEKSGDLGDKNPSKGTTDKNENKKSKAGATEKN